MDHYDELLAEAVSYNENRKGWEQLNDESDYAFSAFCVYRNLPKTGRVKRNVKNCYNAHCKKDNIEPNPNIPSNWYMWSRDFQWKERAEAYDLYLQQLEEAAHHEETVSQIQDFKNRQITLAKQGSDTAMLLLEKATERLKNISDDEINEIPLSALPNFVTAAMKVMTAQTEAEAAALNLDRILEYLEEDEDEESEISYFIEDE